MGEKIWKSQVFLIGTNGSKWSRSLGKWWSKWSPKILQNRRKYWKSEDSCAFRYTAKYQSYGYVTKLFKVTVEKAWTLAQRLDSPPWQCSSSQKAIPQEVFGTKTNYWNGTLILFPSFGSECLLIVFKNKVCL
jgi:hypothetical protein